MLLGFKPRFVEPILIGTKVFTMRGKRKIQPKIGETLHMYTGLRTSKCQLITKSEKLISTQKARVRIYTVNNYLEVHVRVDGRYLTNKELEHFFVFDGFNNAWDFAKYWIQDATGKPYKYGKKYRVGAFVTIYHWTDLRY